jgi:hypothetical protein
VFKLLDAQCKITEQKVADADKQTIQTEGSTLVAPGSDSSSGSSTGGSTVQTTPPATTTRPVVTAPPSTSLRPTALPPALVPPAPPSIQLSH